MDSVWYHLSFNLDYQRNLLHCTRCFLTVKINIYFMKITIACSKELKYIKNPVKYLNIILGLVLSTKWVNLSVYKSNCPLIREVSLPKFSTKSWILYLNDKVLIYLTLLLNLSVGASGGGCGWTDWNQMLGRYN